MSTIPTVGSLLSNDLALRQSGIESLQPTRVDCGKKYREIVEMREFLQSSNGVQVPMPYGFDKRYLYEIIEKEASGVFPVWAELGLLYQRRPDGQEAKEFLDREDIQLHISQIQKEIVEAFSKLALERQDSLQGRLQDWLQDWLQPLNKKGAYLMVRSSGDEDGAYANAGGNESVSYVLPTREAVFTACGRSVASFFGIASLVNRLNAGINPFEKELELGVFVQELVGESPDDNDTIPISLVLFSNKSEYGGNERFRIMRISATYGHGEAVVGNKGCATDSYYLLQSRQDPAEVYILSDTKEKSERLAPVWGQDGKIELIHKQNPEEVICAPALSNQLLVRLFDLGKKIEAFRGNKPSDMEIVVKDNILYPVQVRDANRRIQEPSFLDPVKVHKLPTRPIVEEFFGETQVPGRSAAVVLQSPNELLGCPTLEQAEKRFQLNQHRIILFQEPEPADSHFIVNFSDLQIPCIRLPQLETIKKVQQQLGELFSVVVNVQDGSLHVWDGRIAATESCISQGFFSHPAPLAVSLDGVHLPYLQEGDASSFRELQTLIRAIKSAGTDELAHSALQELSQRQELGFLRSDRLQLSSDLEQFSIYSPRSRIALQAIGELDKRLARAFQEALPLTTERLERLFHVKIIEKLLFQPPGHDGSVGRLSVVTAKELVRETCQIISYAKSVGKNAKLADLILDVELAPLPKTKELWIATIKKFEEQKNLQPFIQLLDLLRHSQSLGVWMTLMIQQEHTSPEAVLTGIDQGVIELMKKLQQESALLRKMRRDIPKFADPEGAEECLMRLGKLVKPYMSEERLKELSVIFSGGSLPAALLAQATLNEVIDLLDKSIKSIKSSPQYSEDDKCAFFCGLVENYTELFMAWMTHLVTADDLKISDARHNDYLYELRKVLNDLMEKVCNGSMSKNEALQPSRWFEVPPALITSQAAFDRHLPVTAEDLFTLVHQNLLAITSALIAKVLSPDILKGLALPQIFKDTTVKVSLLGSVQFLGLSVTKSSVSLCYNLTIRNHSATFELVYDPSSDTTALQFHFLGMARDRWGIICERLCLLHDAGSIRLMGSPEHSPNALHITLLMENATLDNTISILKSAVDFSLSSQWNDTLATAEACVGSAAERSQEELVQLCRYGVRLTTIMPHLKEDMLKANLIKQLTAPTESSETKIHALRCLQDMPLLIFACARPLVYDHDPRVIEEALSAINTYLEERNPLSQEDFVRLKQDSLHVVKEESLNVRSQALKLMKNLIDRGDVCTDAVRYANECLLQDIHNLPESEIKSIVEVAISRREHFSDLFSASVSATYAFYHSVTELGRWIQNALVNSPAAIDHIELLKSSEPHEKQLPLLYCTSATPHQVVIALAHHFYSNNKDVSIREKALTVWYEIGSKHPSCTAEELAQLRQILVKEFLTYDSYLHKTAATLLRDMSFRSKYFPEMISAAVEALLHPEEKMRVQGYLLFQVPITEGVGIEEASKACQALLANPSDSHQKLGKMFESFIIKWKK